MAQRLKTCLTVRGDSYYCPLAVSLDTYWNCLTDCHHCFLRRLNRTWGQDLRPADPAEIEKTLINGLRNNHPRSSLAQALAAKKTIRFGNKADAFQEAEREHGVSGAVMETLIELRWSFVVQTHHPAVLLDLYEEKVAMACKQALLWLMPVMSPGLDKDWEVLEQRRTTPPRQRLAVLQQVMKWGGNGGVNGEPFIPGYHTVDDFEDTLKLLRSYGIRRYNTYNLHLNDHVARRLASIHLDIRRIWYYNQDRQWKVILKQLLELAQKYDMILGCPDFVNSGPSWKEKANTCCGLDVPNPCTFNTHHWKQLMQAGQTPDAVVKETWDGVGDLDYGESIIRGTADRSVFTMKDAGVLQ